MICLKKMRNITKQYWNVIERNIECLPIDSNGLDLGCGQGRLSMPTAQYLSNGFVDACDLSEKAIEQAKLYSSKK